MTSISVLVVDDHPGYRATFCALLSECFPQLAITAAADGSAALRISSTTLFALLILDYQLPWINGSDVIRQLRARNQAWQLAMPPTVLMSAQPDGARYARMAGATTFLPKPTSAAELTAIVGPLSGAARYDQRAAPAVVANPHARP